MDLEDRRRQLLIAMSHPDDFLELSKESIAALTHLLSILGIFTHRNKNQHRHSIWWRHFSVFRRQLSHFVVDLEFFHSKPGTHLERAKRKAHKPVLIARNATRREFWRDVMVPKARNAFSQIVADQRFAQLGLVLLAVLAEVCAIIGLASEMEELGRKMIEEVLEEFGREEWGTGEFEGFRGLERNGEDIGEVVTRAEGLEGDLDTRQKSTLGKRTIEQVEDQTTSTKAEAPTDKETPKKAVKKAKKKRKTGNAIDDLFSGLG